MGKVEFVTVKVQIGNQTKTVKMQKGTSFENKGGIFTADKNGATVKMTNYQMKVFEAVANNTKERGMGDGVVLSAEDIKSAQQKFKQGGFVADMSEFLPDGYKIERPKISTNDKYIEAYVTNGKESQSATLRFAYDVNANNQVNPSSHTNDVISSTRLAPQGKQPIKVVKNKDGSFSYTLPRRREGGSEWPGVTQRVFNIKNGVINKIDIYDTDEYGEAKWHKVITIGNDGAATITEYEYDKKTGTSNKKFDMSRVRKYTNILLQGSYDKIVNNQNGIEIPTIVF